MTTEEIVMNEKNIESYIHKKSIQDHNWWVQIIHDYMSIVWLFYKRWQQ